MSTTNERHPSGPEGTFWACLIVVVVFIAGVVAGVGLSAVTVWWIG